MRNRQTGIRNTEGHHNTSWASTHENSSLLPPAESQLHYHKREEKHLYSSRLCNVVLNLKGDSDKIPSPVL